MIMPVVRRWNNSGHTEKATQALSEIKKSLNCPDEAILSPRSEQTGAFGSQEQADKVFAVLIIVKPLVPRPRCLSQLPTHQPGGVLHVKILAHFPQPFDGRKVLAYGGLKVPG